MARLSLWNSGRKGADYHYQDRTISEFFGASGTSLYVHLYQGVYDQDAKDGSLMPGGVTAIQDVVFLENRDRKYSDQVYEIPGLYNVTDIDFDLRQFGFFLQNDTIFIEIHFNDMIAMMGRKIVAGDVIELPHRRDDMMLDGSKAINRFYVVDDANFASDGYSSTWFHHIWRIKCAPMTAAQESSDILDKEGTDPFGFGTGSKLNDLMSTIGKELEINEKVVDQAKANFVRRNFETQQFWVVPGDETCNQQPWIFAGDGIPPNGAEMVGSGNSFPQDAVKGDYYLRTDYDPPTLFRKMERSWQIQEVNYRHQEWHAAHRLLVDFLNNDKVTTFDDGEQQAEKQALSKVVKPRADF